MPVDLVALLEAVSGLSGLIIAGKKRIDTIRGKRDEDDERVAQTKENIEEMAGRLKEIGECGWSLNDYRDLYDATVRLRMLGNTLFSNLGKIPAQTSPDEISFFRESIESAYRDLRTEFTMNLSKFLEKAEYLDRRDQGMIESNINRLANSFGGTDALLEQTPLDYAHLRTHMGSIVTASVDLVSIANNKIDLITKTLIRLGR